METELTIRQAGAEDYDKVREVIAETFAFHQQAMPQFFRPTDTPPPAKQFIEDLLEDGDGALFIAQDREVVGFLTIRMRQAHGQPYLTHTRWAVVDNLGIIAERQRQGIGHRLMEAAQHWARQQGAGRVQLTVWEFNEGAIAFYESLGYETVSRHMWKMP